MRYKNGHLPLSRFLSSLVLLLLGACSGSAVNPALDLAQQSGADWEQLAGDGFSHLLVSHIPRYELDQLHLYIGGDGQAFRGRLQVSQDPTPKHHLTLQLMLADTSPSAFIARPCYYTTSRDPACNAALWTSARYSGDVIRSMSAVVDTLANRHPRAKITLVGYSGGGVIALLVANSNPHVKTVVTLASPLDIDAWTQLHHYSALKESINPVNQTSWRNDLRQLHFSGAEDENVPPSLLRSLQDKFKLQGVNAEFRTLPAYDHQCCWLEAWPGLLTQKSKPQTDQHQNDNAGN